MLMNLLLCDDQPEDIALLEKMLDRYFFRQPDHISYKIKTCTSGQELLSICEKEQFHAVFLDIDMPKINGIDTAKKLRHMDDRTFIIFVSSYPQYMRDSFEVQAFHFIEKPFSFETIAHVCDILIQKQTCMRSSILSIPTSAGELLRNLDDLILIEAVKGTKNDIRFLFSDHESIQSQGTLAFWEDRLKEQGIISPARGFLINLRHIRIIKNNEIYMSDGSIVQVSRRRSKVIHDLFTDHVISLIK